MLSLGNRQSALRIVIYLTGWMWLSALADAAADDAAIAANSVFEVSRFDVTYGLPHPGLPPVEELRRVEVPLGLKDGVFIPATSSGAAPTAVSLSAVPAGARFSGAALLAVMERIVSAINERGLQVVFVRPDHRQLNLNDFTDLRPPEDRTLTLVVWVGQIAEVRTIAKGERFGPADSINNPAHGRIRAESPIQPTQGDTPGGLFRRSLVDDYVRGLSTHPTRRVEASLASAGEPGKVVLDYLVNEVRPWQLFAQTSNTGTDLTGVWRTRVGLQHTQLTNHDDILNLDFVSSGEFDTKAGLVSYSLPLVRPDTLRLRVFGAVGDFKTGDLGFQQARYTGDNWQAGMELTYRFAVPQPYALVAQTGLTYNHYKVGSSVGSFSGAGGESGFLIPFVAARVSRVSHRALINVATRLEHSVDGVPDESATHGIAMLGRAEPSPSWTVLKAGLSASSYVESLFKQQDARTAVDPGSSLAHEVSASLRGQYVLSRDRLIPQEQELLGGAYTVRGYPESVLAADDSLVATLEYAVHTGRIGAWRRWMPANLGLVVRAFTDYGYRWVIDSPATVGNSSLAERNVAMWSAGAGAEIALWKRLSVRCDAGYVLREITDAGATLAEKGDVRAHIQANFTW